MNDSSRILTSFIPMPAFGQLSDLTKVVRSKAKGRHLVAKENIPSGTLIIKEAAKVALLNPDADDDCLKYCHHCMRWNLITVACKSCTQAVFCSLKCLKESSSYHKYECQCDLYRFRRSDTADSFRIFLTLRAIFTKSIEDHKTSNFSSTDGKVALIQNQNQNYSCFLSGFSLEKMETHQDVKTFQDDLKFLVLTCLMILVIRCTDYLPGNPASLQDLMLSEDEMILGEVANLYLRVQSYNTHPVLTQCQTSKSEVEIVRIGNVINTVAGSVINHSCNPNTIRINSHDPDSGALLTLFITSKSIRK